MAKLFELLAGTSSDHFKIHDVEFFAAPVTLEEYGHFLALQSDDPHNPTPLDARAEFIAEKLRGRVRGKTADPATITTEWVMQNVTLTHLKVIEYVLLHGEMPAQGASPKP